MDKKLKLLQSYSDTLIAELEALKTKLGMRFHPAPIIKRMAAAGYLGKKTGKGFFDYL